MECLAGGLLEVALEGTLMAALGAVALFGLSAYIQAACSADEFLRELWLDACGLDFAPAEAGEPPRRGPCPVGGRGRCGGASPGRRFSSLWLGPL